MVPFQYCSAIYFKVSKPIRHGNELVTFKCPEDLRYPFTEISPESEEEKESADEEVTERHYKVKITKVKVNNDLKMSKRFKLSKPKADSSSILDCTTTKKSKRAKSRLNFRQKNNSTRNSVGRNQNFDIKLSDSETDSENFEKISKKIDQKFKKGLTETWILNCSTESEFDLYFSSEDEKEMNVSTSQLEFIPFV